MGKCSLLSIFTIWRNYVHLLLLPEKLLKLNYCLLIFAEGCWNFLFNFAVWRLLNSIFSGGWAQPALRSWTRPRVVFKKHSRGFWWRHTGKYTFSRCCIEPKTRRLHTFSTKTAHDTLIGSRSKCQDSFYLQFVSETWIQMSLNWRRNLISQY